MENIPTIGEKVLLSDIANRSVGGTLEMLNVNDMHPDYIELSGDICRTFRLGSVGIDVISPDISKSWREVGVIIEINCNPMAAPELADKILESHFGNNEGRIDTTLVISDDDKMARNIFNKMKKTFEKPGFASVDIAEFASGPLITKNEGLAHRCLSLVLNKGCDAVVVSITPEEIMENGLPLDYFDHCVIDAKSNINNEMVKKSLTLSTKFDKLENWLKQYVGHINN
jgi:cyanophycin synthetase